MRFLVSPEQSKLLKACQALPKPELRFDGKCLQPFIDWLEVATKHQSPDIDAWLIIHRFKVYHLDVMGYDLKPLNAFLKWLQVVSEIQEPGEDARGMIANFISYCNAVEVHQEQTRELVTNYWR